MLGKKLAKLHHRKKALNPKSKAELDNMREKSREAIEERTEERKQAILEFLQRELEHQKALANCSVEDRQEGISREDVEKLLDVSTTTALKYLNELEEEKRIIQVGTHGPSVYYTLPN